MSSTITPIVGIVICSQRQPRICDQIANYVLETISNNKNSSSPPVKLQLIDLLEWNLPMFNEPALPAHCHSTSDYQQPHTRAWSLEIKKYSGFIFVTPQYNWGYPASVKNAIDYLYNEWKTKPAMIVSYGSHGGGKCAVQLRQVLNGVHMNVVETMPMLAWKSKDVDHVAVAGGKLNLGGEDGMWWEEKKIINQAFGEMEALLFAKSM